MAAFFTQRLGLNMKTFLRLFAYLAIAATSFGASANDLILTQRKSDNSGNIERQVTAAASSLLGFTSSVVPTKVLIGTGLSFDTSTNTLSATGTGGTWGSITGTLSAQTDLNNALAAKQTLDDNLTAFAALDDVAGDQLPYGTGILTFGYTTLTSFARR